MEIVENGNTVKVHYTGKLESGEVFDSSENKDPLQFTVGEKKMIPGFEKAVLGMKTGESKTISIPPNEAYGEKNSELVFDVPKEKLPDNINPALGQELQLIQQDGQRVPVIITSISDADVTIDANHPLAGEELTFELEVVEIS